MIIDEKSVLSAYDDNCTLLQAINTLNNSILKLSFEIGFEWHNVYLSDNEPANPSKYKGGSIWFNYSTGILYERVSEMGAKWVIRFKFAQAV